jgi:dolichol kinase
MWSSNPINPELVSLVDKIFVNTFYRKLYHLVGGSLIVGGLILLELEWFIALCILYILAFYIISKRISFVIIGILLLLLLSNSIVITLSATTIWVVGDGLAGLVGAAFGKRRWPWHPHKTVLGSVAFFVGSFLAVLVVLISMVDASLKVVILLGLISSLGACIVEFLPITLIKDRKVDDNLMIIIASGLLIQLLTAWFSLEAGF